MALLLLRCCLGIGLVLSCVNGPMGHGCEVWRLAGSLPVHCLMPLPVPLPLTPSPHPSPSPIWPSVVATTDDEEQEERKIFDAYASRLG